MLDFEARRRNRLRIHLLLRRKLVGRAIRSVPFLAASSLAAASVPPYVALSMLLVFALSELLFSVSKWDLGLRIWYRPRHPSGRHVTLTSYLDEAFPELDYSGGYTMRDVALAELALRLELDKKVDQRYGFRSLREVPQEGRAAYARFVAEDPDGYRRAFAEAELQLQEEAVADGLAKFAEIVRVGTAGDATRPADAVRAARYAAESVCEVFRLIGPPPPGIGNPSTGGGGGVPDSGAGVSSSGRRG